MIKQVKTRFKNFFILLERVFFIIRGVIYVLRITASGWLSPIFRVGDF